MITQTKSRIFCNPRMPSWEMPANLKPIGTIWPPPLASFRVNIHKFLAKIYLIFHILKWYSTTEDMLIQIVCPVTTWTNHYGSKLLWYRLVSMVFESIKNILYWIRIELLCHKTSDSVKIIEIRLTTLKNTTTYLNIFISFNQCAVHTPFRNPKIWTGQYLSPNS